MRSETSAKAAYAAGAREIAYVDLASGLGLADAVARCRAVYHLAPNVHHDEVGMATRVVEAAGAAACGASSSTPCCTRTAAHAPPPAQGRGRGGRAPVRAGWTMLRPAAYHQNLTGRPTMVGLVVPYRLDAPFTNVDLRDVAEVAATVLGTDGHEGRTYDLCGAETLTVSRMAHTAATVLDHQVTAGDRPRRVGPGARGGCRSRPATTCWRCSRPTTGEGFIGSAAALRILLRPLPAPGPTPCARTTPCPASALGNI